MKLAEALILRADLQRQIAQTSFRMGQNVLIQEGDEPAEDVTEMLAQYNRMMSELEELIIKINRTNSRTAFEDGYLADALTRRDRLKAKISAYRELYHQATSTTGMRYSRSEIRYVRCVDTAMLQKKIDEMSKEYRELDTRIQGMNWTVDLDESV